MSKPRFGSDIVDPRIEREARWCYERRLERMTMRDIAELSSLHPDDGGLGNRISTQTVHRRVKHYHAQMLKLETETRDEARGREIELLDKTSRAAADLVDPVDRAATAKRRAVVASMGGNPDDPGNVILRDDTVRLRALKLLVEVSDSRRKLLGLDAPAEHNLNVTVTDAATAELNAMLAEVGLPPVESETPA